MCRKMQFVFLITFALISSNTARFIHDNDVFSSEEIFKDGHPLDNFDPNESWDRDDSNTKEDDGILPLYRISSDGDEKELNERIFEDGSKENMDRSDEEEVIPELDERIGIPLDYDSNRNGVVLRNKFGEGDGEEKQPGWLRRQWRRLGNVATAFRKGKEISTDKVNEFTEKICTLIKFMTSKASKLCEIVPMKICEPFYGPKDPDAIVLPQANPLDLANNLDK